MDQPKVQRTLRLMKLMTGNTTYTVEELADKLGTSYRSIYRYIDTFREAGFAVRKVRTGVYELVTMGRRSRDIDRLVYFSDEEAAIVNGLIESLDNTNALKQNLHQKLAAIYDVAPVTEFISRKSNALNVRELSNAIQDRRCVILHDFKSSSGNSRDRHIEPFAFTTNYIHVWGYDLEDGRCKMFGIARIGEVEVLQQEEWQHSKEHRSAQTDVFRMSGERNIHVKLLMDLHARDLLLEEFPTAAADISPEGDKWLLETDVAGLKGVGRFAIGLADHISVVESPELEEYIHHFIELYLQQ